VVLVVADQEEQELHYLLQMEHLEQQIQVAVEVVVEHGQ
jgi:hypothetical protein